MRVLQTPEQSGHVLARHRRASGRPQPLHDRRYYVRRDLRWRQDEHVHVPDCLDDVPSSEPHERRRDVRGELRGDRQVSEHRDAAVWRLCLRGCDLRKHLRRRRPVRHWLLLLWDELHGKARARYSVYDRQSVHVGFLRRRLLLRECVHGPVRNVRCGGSLWRRGGRSERRSQRVCERRHEVRGNLRRYESRDVHLRWLGYAVSRPELRERRRDPRGGMRRSRRVPGTHDQGLLAAQVQRRQVRNRLRHRRELQGGLLLRLRLNGRGHLPAEARSGLRLQRGEHVHERALRGRRVLRRRVQWAMRGV